MNRTTRRHLRCLLVAASATAVAALLACLLRPAGLLGPVADATAAIDRLCRLGLLAVDAWAWAAVLAGVAEAWSTVQAAPRTTPGRTRRWVLTACGVTLGCLATSPALAAAPRHDPAPPPLTTRLSGLPLPERAVGPAHRPAVVVVRAGDSLWSIAVRRLGDGAQWTAIYRTNRSAVGADPDLLWPGTRLRLPPHSEGGHR